MMQWMTNIWKTGIMKKKAGNEDEYEEDDFEEDYRNGPEKKSTGTMKRKRPGTEEKYTIPEGQIET